MKERLDKCLAPQLGMSRAEVQKLIRYGGVAVDGRAVKDPKFKVEPENSEIFVHGKRVEYKKFVYIMMNKPLGVVSASNDRNEKTVVDLVPEYLRHRNLFPAGRLDKDTTGFVLITDDGQFAHDILSPKKHVEKTYIAVTDDDISSEKLEIIRMGLELETVSFSSAQIEKIEEKGEKFYWRIILKEGKYHEIKRMIAFAGVNLLSLHRVKMGDLELDESLLPGESREITDEEKEKIRG